MENISFKVPKWNIEAETGYKPKTTFWIDFSIADKFGPEAVQDTFNRAFPEWRDKIVYLTELSLVLNHKIWQWHGVNETLAKLYDKLWKEVDQYAADNLGARDCEYYFGIID